MTELYIDGTLVSLPKELTLSLKHQNPFITKNGEFTLDLELPIDDINNSKLYHHLNRLHANADIKGRKAVLICDNKVVLNGTEVITSHTEKTVTIQLVSGNSELNYFIETYKYLSELDLGEETNFTPELLSSIVSHKYPQSNFCPAPVYSEKEMYNGSFKRDGQWFVYEKIRMQPFLLAMMEKVVTALGYTIKINYLHNDPLISRVYFPNARDTLKYNEILPGWTVKGFLEEIEKLFNTVFYIDQKTRSVVINTRASFYTGAQVQCIATILDDFGCEIHEEPEWNDYRNVVYDFPKTNYFKYCDISKDVMDKESGGSEFDTFAAIRTATNMPEVTNDVEQADPGKPPTDYNSLKTFFCKGTGLHYIIDLFSAKFDREGHSLVKKWWYLRDINKFHGTYNTNIDELKLKFYPVEIGYNDRVPDGYFSEIDSYPCLNEKEEKSEIEKEYDRLADYILKGAAEKKITEDASRPIAIYMGPTPTIHTTSNEFICVETDYYMSNVLNKARKIGNVSLRLTGENGLIQRYYQTNDKYDFTREYTFRFIAHDMPDVRGEFLICNKKFICKEMEYTVVAEGLHPVVTGVFYPVIK